MTKRDARRRMPWKEPAAWNERVKFITALMERDESFT